ncbi:MAG: toxin-antitoxin system YwqK family antitoxin [Psychroserpens sp.]|nr:toxin-antitoxin system YwqK family antitoxin [Psychroserpens sp.]
MKSTLSFIFILTLFSLSIYGQDTVNQFDKDGNRHGVWKKYFDKTDQLRYEGRFEHGKEIDTFKFYRLNKKKSVLSAVKVFNPNDDRALVTFYSSKGQVISKGQLNGKIYVGEWIYYHNNSSVVMTSENFNDQGELDGERITYYKNGKPTEVLNYANGKLEGNSKWYDENGTLLKDLNYENDELHGPAKYYDIYGKLAAEGIYQRGRKHRIWKYYKGDKLVETKDHTRRSKNPKKQ